MKPIYLANPYTHPNPTVQEMRFNLACLAASQLMWESNMIFSPVAHCHPIALAGGLPTDWKFWAQYDRAMIEACDEFWVLMLDGWRDSKGVAAEIAIAKELGLRVRYIDPATLRETIP